MLLLNPRTIRFGSSTWDNVTSIAIDREAHKLITEWNETGPHATFADVPEQRVVIRVTQELARDDIDAPHPGDEGAIEFHTSPTSSAAGRKRITATAVLADITHQLSLKGGAIRTARFIAISPDGTTDPVTLADPEVGGDDE